MKRNPPISPDEGSRLRLAIGAPASELWLPPIAAESADWTPRHAVDLILEDRVEVSTGTLAISKAQRVHGSQEPFVPDPVTVTVDDPHSPASTEENTDRM